jgi:hypothetical protein
MIITSARSRLANVVGYGLAGWCGFDFIAIFFWLEVKKLFGVFSSRGGRVIFSVFPIFICIA